MERAKAPAPWTARGYLGDINRQEKRSARLRTAFRLVFQIRLEGGGRATLLVAL